LIFAPANNSRSAISILQLALCVALIQTAARRGLFPDADHSAPPETRRNKRNGPPVSLGAGSTGSKLN
jgi:hypothetical protein